MKKAEEDKLRDIIEDQDLEKKDADQKGMARNFSAGFDPVKTE